MSADRRTLVSVRGVTFVTVSRKLELLERYRVPYEVDGQDDRGAVRLHASERPGVELVALAGGPSARAEFCFLADTPLYAAVAAQDRVDAFLASSGQDWRADLPITDVAGTVRAHVYRSSHGSVLLPFDVDEPLDALLRERYVPDAARTPQATARAVYYRLRPVLPRSLQLALRRRFRTHQDRSPFPAWPTETALHRLEALLLGLIEEVAAAPLPWIAPWPRPFEWALVLTHDVEHAAGYDHIHEVRSVEADRGLRSAWYFVPERDYQVEEALLEGLRADGCEICLHGLRHDGRDLSAREFPRRLPRMRAVKDRWGARGFRSPATHRDWLRVQDLGVAHDSSWSDVARYEPQPGGSCSWLPFFIGEVVELPITLPMDHTLFELLRVDAREQWNGKARFLREHCGMAVMLTHPDYLLDQARLSAYDAFLAGVADDESAWHALPGEVADWWRDRAATDLEKRDGGWHARGPIAANAAVRIGAPRPPASMGYAGLAA